MSPFKSSAGRQLGKMLEENLSLLLLDKDLVLVLLLDLLFSCWW